MRTGHTVRALLLAGWAALQALPSASAQLIELNGGVSSVYQAEGGTVTLHGQGYQAQLGAGVVAGRAVGGAEVAYNYRHTDFLLGTEQLRLNLPTDLFNDYHQMIGVGATMRRTTEAGTRLEAFAGATSSRFDTPLFEGIRAERPAAAFLMEKPLGHNLRLSTQAVYASNLSLIESLAWKPRPDFEAAVSAGLGAGAGYAAASVNLKRPRFDLKASYIDVGSQFTRTGSQTDLSPEPIRENVLVTWRSRGDARLTLTGGRQNSVVSSLEPGASTSSATTLPDAPGNISTLDQISGSFRLERTAFTASLLQSSYKGEGNISFALAASKTISREMRIQVSYYESHPRGPAAASVNRTVVATVQRELTSRITASGNATLTNGQTNLSLGGSILSNLGTVSADYQTFYVPSRPGNPFQQALVVDLQVNLLGRLTAHAASFVGATGKLLYTFDLHASQGVGGAATASVVQHVNLGECVMRGRVLDQARNPVEGAALNISGKIVLTDSDGGFFLREKKPEVHSFEVLLDQFLDGGNWRLVSRPLRLQSTREPPPDVLIVVERTSGALDSKDLSEPPLSEAAAIQPAPIFAPAAEPLPVPVAPQELLPPPPSTLASSENPEPSVPAVKTETVELQPAPQPALAPPPEEKTQPAETVSAARNTEPTLQPLKSVAPQTLPSHPAPQKAEQIQSVKAKSRSTSSRALHSIAHAASWLYTQTVHWWNNAPSDGLQ